MTSSDWAAWVQAIGSIAAIFGAAGIAIWQSGRQQKNALALLRAERRFDRTELAKALLTLSTNCRRLLEHYAAQFPDRDSVENVAEGRVHVDLNELKVVEGAVLSIPLHSLPHVLVSLTMMVSSTVRQFRENVDFALKSYRSMDSNAFEKFFDVLSELQLSLKLTCEDIQTEIDKLENDT
jgi:hypothetical protein